MPRIITVLISLFIICHAANPESTDYFDIKRAGKLHSYCQILKIRSYSVHKIYQISRLILPLEHFKLSVRDQGRLAYLIFPGFTFDSLLGNEFPLKDNKRNKDERTRRKIVQNRKIIQRRKIVVITSNSISSRSFDLIRIPPFVRQIRLH